MLVISFPHWCRSTQLAIRQFGVGLVAPDFRSVSPVPPPGCEHARRIKYDEDNQGDPDRARRLNGNGDHRWYEEQPQRGHGGGKTQRHG